MFRQVTSAPAHQYSVLVIHAFSPFIIGSVERTGSRQESLFGCIERSRTRLAAEFANMLVSVRRRSGGAEGKSSKSCIYDFRFCRCQFASTPANQHSVLVIHIYPFIIWVRWSGPKAFQREIFRRPDARGKSRSPRRRAAMKISTRREKCRRLFGPNY